jgi:hypothetical protein
MVAAMRSYIELNDPRRLRSRDIIEQQKLDPTGLP